MLLIPNMPIDEPNPRIPDSSAFEDAHRKVSLLVEIFRANHERFTSSDYSEAQARIDFIDKFWLALGWDVNHERQTNPYEQGSKKRVPHSKQPTHPNEQARRYQRDSVHTPRISKHALFRKRN